MSKTNHRRGSLVLVVLTLAVALAACGGGDDDNATPGSTEGTQAPAANEVVIRLIAFRPESLVVPRGTTVVWKQQDDSSHTVTSGTVTQGAGDVTTAPDGTFDSGSLAKDATFEFTFGEPGKFTYFCAVHPATMRGEVEVT